MDGSIWAVENYLPDYCSVGDVIGDGHGKPTAKALLIKANKEGALRSPAGFSLVWKNDRSLTHSDVNSSLLRTFGFSIALGFSAISTY